MVEKMPDWNKFKATIGSTIEALAGGSGAARVRIYGEMVDVLWRDGNPQAAIHLEELWNDLGNSCSFSLLCAYRMGNFYKEADGAHFQHICRTHSLVVPSESYPQGDEDGARLREELSATACEVAGIRERAPQGAGGRAAHGAAGSARLRGSAAPERGRAQGLLRERGGGTALDRRGRRGAMGQQGRAGHARLLGRGIHRPPDRRVPRRPGGDRGHPGAARAQRNAARLRVAPRRQ